MVRAGVGAWKRRCRIGSLGAVSVCVFGASTLGVFGCSRTALELPLVETRTEMDGGTADTGPDGPCRWGFAPAVRYDLSGFPVDVAIADFDGDRVPDVLTVNTTSGQITLLGNRGDGTLAERAPSTIGTMPRGFAVADFSGDGSLDLAILYPNPSTPSSAVLGIFLNRGDGTFRSDVAYQSAGGASGVIVAGDFDGDDQTDLAVSNGGQNLYLFQGRGDGTFEPPREHVTPPFASHLTVADLDRDGALDLAAVGAFYAIVLLNRGNAEFREPVVYDNSPACNHVGPITAGDLTGDDYPELIRSCYQSGHAVAVRTNLGDATFGEEITHSTGQWPYRMVVGEFTGDGLNDLAVADSWAHARTVSVLPNLGDGSFGPHVAYETIASRSIAAGDLNGDGHADLATAGSHGTSDPIGTVSVLLAICE